MILAGLLFATQQPPTADDLTRFVAAYERRSEEGLTEREDAALIEAMEIVGLTLRQARQTGGEDGVRQALNVFERAIGEPSDDMLDPSHLDGSADLAAPFEIVTAQMGAVGRLFVWDVASGRRLQTPAEFNWLFPFALSAQTVGGRLVAEAYGVQPAGVRSSFRVYFLNRDGDRLTVAREIRGTMVLGLDEVFGGTRVEGDRLTLETVEEPNSFLTPSYMIAFPLTQVWRLSPTGEDLLSTTRGMPDLRAVDRWMADARRSARPSEAMRAFRTASPEPELLGDFSSRKIDERTTELTFSFDRTMTFRVKQTGDRYEVIGFSLRTRS